MGIDPVTHTPRLDLLNLSSILTSSLYASSSQTQTNTINIPRLLNGTRPLNLNPELLKLASSLIHISHQQPQNLTFCPQNGQETQDNHIPHHDDHFFQAEQVPSSSTYVDPNPPNSNFTNYVTDQLPSYDYNYSSDYISHQSSLTDPPLMSETSTFQYSNNSSCQNFGFASVLSPPSSSPRPLNSNYGV